MFKFAIIFFIFSFIIALSAPLIILESWAHKLDNLFDYTILTSLSFSILAVIFGVIQKNKTRAHKIWLVIMFLWFIVLIYFTIMLYQPVQVQEIKIY